MSPTSEPPPPAARIVQLDVLRGLGVLGILMVNAGAFAMPPAVYSDPALAPFPLQGPSAALWWGVHTFFEQKFITLFTLLFGVSVFLVGGEAGDRARGPVLRRRLLWLGVFGLIHGAAIWYGDILLHYALIGLVFAPCRSWRPRRLWAVGLGLFLVGALLMVSPTLDVAPPRPLDAETRAPSAAVLREIEAFAGGLAQAQVANVRAWFSTVVQITPVYGWRTLGLMMIGLALFKQGVLQGARSTGAYLALTAAGGAALAVIGWRAWATWEAGFPGASLATEASDQLLSPVVALGYVGLVTLALRRRGFAPRGRAPGAALGGALGGALSAVGRMAFTNYIAQSLIMTTVFYGGRGLGLFGALDWPARTVLVLAVWAAQLLWSPWWLSRFGQGPLERLWRKLSHAGAPGPAEAR